MKNYVQTTYRIEECLMKRIKQEVLLHKEYSINGFINDCIRYSLDNIVIVDE